MFLLIILTALHFHVMTGNELQSPDMHAIQLTRSVESYQPASIELQGNNEDGDNLQPTAPADALIQNNVTVVKSWPGTIQ